MREKLPSGTIISDPTDFDEFREDIMEGTKQEFSKIFPQSYGGVRLEVENVRVEGPERFTIKEQKEALLNNRILSKKLRGTLKLIDEESGKVLDEKDMSLLKIPYMTNRGTFIHNGSEYTTLAQPRLMAGTYVRRKANNELEAHVNAQRGSGSSFRIMMDPATAAFKMQIGGSSIKLYPLLKAIGVTDEELKERWGEDILENNRTKDDPRIIHNAYKGLVRKPDNSLPIEDKIKAIKEALDETKVSKTVLKRNLPNYYDANVKKQWNKQASEIESQFAPDLSPEDLKELGVFDSLYDKSKPRLASLEEWPEEWLTDDNPQGWLQWYEKYSKGQKQPEDTRQIKRWLSFKARHGGPFKKNPTPRRAYALLNWGIDPVSLIEDEQQAEELVQKMQEYKEKVEKNWENSKQKSASSEVDKALSSAANATELLNLEYELDLDVPTDIREADYAIKLASSLIGTKEYNTFVEDIDPMNSHLLKITEKPDYEDE